MFYYAQSVVCCVATPHGHQHNHEISTNERAYHEQHEVSREYLSKGMKRNTKKNSNLTRCVYESQSCAGVRYNIIVVAKKKERKEFEMKRKIVENLNES